MSSNDKTGDQLANTIRQAKTGTTASPADKPSAPAKAPVKKAPAKKASTAKKKAARPAVKKTDAPKQTAAIFQHGRRVWPD